MAGPCDSDVVCRITSCQKWLCLRGQGQPVSPAGTTIGRWRGVVGERVASSAGAARPSSGSDPEGGVMPTGLKASVVGVGPGSPELVTPAARRAVQSSGIVLGWDLDLKPVEDCLKDKKVFLQDVKNYVRAT